MNICHFLGSLNRGGTEILAYDTFKNISISEKTFIFLYRRGGDLENDFQTLPIPVVKLNYNKFLFFLYIYRLRLFLYKYQIDIIHTHHPFDTFLSILASFGTKIKIISTHHGFAPYWLTKLLLLYTIPRVDKNVFVSWSCLEMYKSFLKKKSFSNFEIIYNGVDIRRLQLEAKESRITKEYNIGKDDIILGMVGNFYANARDQLTICKALPMVFNAIGNTHFLFIGGKSAKNPNYFDECYNYCFQNNLLARVHFLGLRKNISEILQIFDIYVASSNYETFGIAIIEAMTLGIPVLTNNLPTYKELSKNGKYFYHFESRDSKDLADKIVQLIYNPEQRKLIGEKGKKYIIREFNIQKHINALYNLYDDL